MATPSPPKLAAVRARLLELADGVAEDGMLPSERSLAAEWSVARMTIRRAMDDLVEEGRLERRHGIGTFVRRPKVERPLNVTSFSEEIRSRGLEPSSEVLSFRDHVASKTVALRLGIPVGDRALEFTRLRLADGTPIAIEQTTVAAALVPGLRPTDLDGSWYGLLADRYGVHVAGGTIRLEAVLPTPAQARLLQIGTAVPCQRARVVVRDATGQTIDSCETVHRSDRYAVVAELGPSSVASLGSAGTPQAGAAATPRPGRMRWAREPRRRGRDLLRHAR